MLCFQPFDFRIFRLDLIIFFPEFALEIGEFVIFGGLLDFGDRGRQPEQIGGIGVGTLRQIAELLQQTELRNIGNVMQSRRGFQRFGRPLKFSCPLVRLHQCRLIVAVIVAVADRRKRRIVQSQPPRSACRRDLRITPDRLIFRAVKEQAQNTLADCPRQFCVIVAGFCAHNALTP